MKFKFSDNLEYQTRAIESVVGLFDMGTNVARGMDAGSRGFALQSPATCDAHIVCNVLDIDETRILKNLRAIQRENGIEESGEMLGSLDFSIEMETGTGKTYVYLRTAFGLNRAYGLTKFIILVPSVAIREGVLKTMEQTKDHFRALYGVGYSAFAYDSSKLSQVRDFAQSADIHIMVMTVQSFADKGERLVMRQTPDRFHGERPIDLIAGTHPVVIMDEPQNMESNLQKEAIADLQPLFKLRYSATHKEIHNLVYRLTPVEAYTMNLVKKIDVYGVTYHDSNERMFSVRSLGIKDKKPVASVVIEKKEKGGTYVCQTMDVRAGDDIFRKSGGNDIYAGIIVTDVNKQHDFVALSDGTEHRMEAGERKEDMFRTQIAETIKAHMMKQETLGSRAKVLSLFFIDKVDNYVNEGLIARIFDEEFNRMKGRFALYANKEASLVRAGYFASKKEKGEIIYKDTNGASKSDKDAYDLIMKDKERLLSFDEPVSFIFSHSALKEGWDNPNIFQICTLRETKSEMKKRQEIGRGLRLPLDGEGNRIYDTGVNTLTVIANESYEDYVGTLQREFEDAGYIKGTIPIPANAREKVSVQTVKKYLADTEFVALWNKISEKTTFNIDIDTDTLVARLVEKLNELTVQTLAVTVDRVSMYFDDTQHIRTSFISEGVVPVLRQDIHIGDIVGRIAKETGITRTTALRILEEIDHIDMAFEHPEEFTRATCVIVNGVLEDLLVNESLRYAPTGEYWEIELFKGFESYLTRLMETKKSPFSHVEFDGKGEREFAEHLEHSPHVKVYTKLPRGFYVDTPIGEYRPDWAIVWHTDEGDTLYLVRETKFYEGMSKEHVFTMLRPDEQKKILCGQKHFDAIGANFAVATDKDLRDLL